MAVTFEQIREKRTEFRALKAKKDAALDTYLATQTAHLDAVNVFNDLQKQCQGAEYELQILGGAFALDDGEEAVQNTLDLTEKPAPAPKTGESKILPPPPNTHIDIPF